MAVLSVGKERFSLPGEKERDIVLNQALLGYSPEILKRRVEIRNGFRTVFDKVCAYTGFFPGVPKIGLDTVEQEECNCLLEKARDAVVTGYESDFNVALSKVVAERSNMPEKEMYNEEFARFVADKISRLLNADYLSEAVYYYRTQCLKVEGQGRLFLEKECRKAFCSGFAGLVKAKLYMDAGQAWMRFGTIFPINKEDLTSFSVQNEDVIKFEEELERMLSVYLKENPLIFVLVRRELINAGFLDEERTKCSKSVICVAEGILSRARNEHPDFFDEAKDLFQEIGIKFSDPGKNMLVFEEKKRHLLYKQIQAQFRNTMIRFVHNYPQFKTHPLLNKWFPGFLWDEEYDNLSSSD